MYIPHVAWLEARQDQPPEGSRNPRTDENGSQGGSNSSGDRTKVGIVVRVYLW